MNAKIKQYLWNTIGVSINSFISLLYLIIVTRFNGLNHVGVFSFVFSFSLIIYAITSFGGRIYQVSDVDEFETTHYFSFRFISSLVGIIIALLYIILFDSFDNRFLLIVFWLLIRIIESFSDVIYGIFQRHHRIDLVGKSLVIKNVINLLVFLFLEYTTKNVLFSTIGVFVSTFIIFVLFDYVISLKFEKIKITLNRKLIQLFKAGKYTCYFSLITVLIANISRFIVDWKLDEVTQGYFGIIIMIPTVMALFGQFFIQPEIVPITKAVIAKDRKDINTRVNRTIIILFVLSIVCILSIMICGEFILELLYGISFDGKKLILCLALIGGLFNAITSIYSNVLTVLRKTKIQLILYSCSCMMLALLTYFLSFDLYGIFIAYMISMFIQMICFMICYHIKFRKVVVL